MPSSTATRARRALTLALLAVIAAFAYGAGAASAAAAVPTRVMPLGDSITHGYNVPGGYRIELEDLLIAGGHPFDFVGSGSNGPAALADQRHEGHEGWRIDRIAANVDPWLARYQPEVVLLLIGTNDILQLHELDGAPGRLSVLIDRIAAGVPAASIIVASLPPLGTDPRDERVRRYNAAIPGVVDDQVARGRRVSFVDMYPALTRADLADGIHPNQAGYDRMAAVWHSALQAVLPAPAEPTPVPEPTPTPTPTPQPAPEPPPPAATPTPAPVMAPSPETTSVAAAPATEPPAVAWPSSPAPSPAQPSPRSAPSARSLVTLQSRAVRLDQGGRLPIVVRCRAATSRTCAGTLSASVRGTGRSASARFRIAGGRSTRVELRLTRTQLRGLRRRATTRLLIETRVRDSAGAASTAKTPVTLRR